MVEVSPPSACCVGFSELVFFRVPAAQKRSGAGRGSCKPRRQAGPSIGGTGIGGFHFHFKSVPKKTVYAHKHGICPPDPDLNSRHLQTDMQLPEMCSFLWCPLKTIQKAPIPQNDTPNRGISKASADFNARLPARRGGCQSQCRA